VSYVVLYSVYQTQYALLQVHQREKYERNPQEEKLTTSREEKQERRTAMCKGSTIGLPYESSRAILRYRADGTPC